MTQPQGHQQGGPRRPGAMTMAMQAVAARPTGPKVLRIGLIQSGKIVEERIVRKRETVSVGTSERNHFIVRAQNLPARFDLFQLVGNEYILNFTPDMRGRVGLPGGVKELGELRSTGGARNAGTHFQIKLSDSSRGKIVIGDTTLLFQFVVPPPVTPRPQLPAAARGGFVSGIDWLFTAFVVFSYMAFFGFVIYLENADWPIDQGITAIPESAARLIFQEPPPPDEPEVTEEVTDDGEAEAEVAEESTSRSNNNNASSGRSNDPAASAEARARIAQEAAAQAEAMILGALGEGGALADVLAGGAVLGSAEDVLAQADGVGVADSSGGGNLRTRTGGGGSGQQGSLGSLRATKTAAAMEGGAVMERVVRGTFRMAGGGDIGGSGDFDQGRVSSAIRARSAAFRACYERELRNNPSLAGKVTVQFTIVPAGTVSGASAVENTTGSASLGSCVVSTISRLRWNPGPDGGSVSFRYPFVFAPQN